MKTTIYLSFLILIFSFLGCSETEVDSPLEIKETLPFPTLELVYPLQDEDVHYCCFTFQWDDFLEDEEYRIEVSSSSSFDDLLIDTIVNTKFLKSPTFFNPKTTYYWQITAINSERTSTNKFTIIDYVDRLEGSHDAKITMYSWNGLEGTTIDTTFITILNIWKGDDNSISYNTEHSNGKRNLPFSEVLKEDGILYRIDHQYPRNKDRLSYLFETDSIFIYHESGGLGGYGYTSISSKK